MSGLYLALTDEPQSSASWALGSSGERKLGAFLETLNDDASLIALHDRRIPRSQANIDHLVVSRAGIFVIDAKHYTGRVQRRDCGGLLSADFRLYVGRRDQSKLIAGMAKQVEAVRKALGEPVMEELALSITPVLCFVDADWSLFAGPFQLGGVWVESPAHLAKRLRKPGHLTPEHVLALTKRVVAALPRA